MYKVKPILDKKTWSISQPLQDHKKFVININVPPTTLTFHANYILCDYQMNV